MRKTVLILMAAAALIFGATAVAALIGEEEIPGVAAAPETEPSAAFTIRAHNGIVAVFSDGFAAPAFETDISVHRLRGYDRELLERGIAVRSYEELLALIEDFSN